MGGTSTDVCLVAGGSSERAEGREVAGFPIRLPMVDVHTVGAGGGSIVWRDAGGALRVGPRSAGAEPGPACYGRGGLAPTVTDANLLLGRLPARAARWAGARPGGSRSGARRHRPCRRDRRRRTRKCCARCASSRSSAATIRATSRSSRSEAPGRCTRAPSPTSWAVARVLVPAAAGVLSALGLVASDERRDHVASVRAPARRGRRAAGRRARPAFATAGSRSSSRCRSGRTSQSASTRCTRSGTATPTELASSSSSPCVRPTSCPARPSSSRARPGALRTGPELVELAGATCWVPDGWAGATDAHGTLVLERHDDPGRAAGDRQHAARDRRGDGRGARARRVLLEHQGAARLLDRALRRPSAA